jgi:calcineurin-like phosphoesterase family protein
VAEFFTADPHFGHRNIVDFCSRPWADVDEMDDGLVANYNSVVGPEDTLWFVGDIAIRREGLTQISRINGRKILVAGNHDACWVGHRKQGRARNAIKWYLDAGFDEVHTGTVKTVLGGRPVLISHLPYATPHGSGGEEEGWVDKYATRRPVDEGLPLICGHVHEKWRTHPTHGRMFNVGVDANSWFPVAESEIVSWVRSR